MTLEAWITLGTIAIIVIALTIKKRIGPDLVMAGGLVVLMITRVVNWEDAAMGFADRPLLMIAGLFVIAAALQETGGIELIGRRVLGRPTNLARAQLRMMIPVAAMSAFMNTTPIVAMYLPMVSDWAKRLAIQPSKLFMPLSFAGILGGQGTMIGTGSNLIIIGLFVGWWKSPPGWIANLNIEPISGATAMWGAAWIGVPVAVLGMLFIVLTSRWLLPNRASVRISRSDMRKYEIKMLIEDDSPIIGKTIAQAGLRSLDGLYLYAIIREDQLIHTVTPEEVLFEGDKLVFVGDVESVVDLRKIRGLVPASKELEELDDKRLTRRTMIEAVIAGDSPLVGQLVRDSQFRSTYNAVILAVHRRRSPIRKKIGDIILRAGDTLLIESNVSFLATWKYSRDFYLVSQVEDSRPPLHHKAWLSLGILGLLVILLTTKYIGLIAPIWLCGLLMVATGCISGPAARKAINIQVLIVIGAAMGIGQAVAQSGLATSASNSLIAFTNSIGVGNHGTLFAIFLLTSIAAQLMTNFGAAVIMFPIVIGAAQGLGVSPYPFVFTMMAAAGCNFLTPVT
ncbi:MAG: SLC13 family permease, partial [Phycisphaerales bacterium]|nr:SLC13 family permease [Phycisphaerales bacterium]